MGPTQDRGAGGVRPLELRVPHPRRLSRAPSQPLSACGRVDSCRVLGRGGAGARPGARLARRWAESRIRAPRRPGRRVRVGRGRSRRCALPPGQPVLLAVDSSEPGLHRAVRGTGRLRGARVPAPGEPDGAVQRPRVEPVGGLLRVGRVRGKLRARAVRPRDERFFFTQPSGCRSSRVPWRSGSWGWHSSNSTRVFSESQWRSWRCRS